MTDEQKMERTRTSRQIALLTFNAAKAMPAPKWQQFFKEGHVDDKQQYAVFRAKF